MEKQIKLLVVDDEPIVLDSIKKLLKREVRYNIHTFPDVSSALKFMDKNDTHIILTDLMMPDIDGLEFIRLVKDKNPAVHMIMITGYATINTALQAMQVGAFDYIAKPFTRDELKNVLKRAADLVEANSNGSNNTASIKKEKTGNIKGIGQNTWLMTLDDGNVLIGCERHFLLNMGNIQTVYMPEEGDELRQGSTYFQIFSADLRSQSLLSPISGIVIETNKDVIDNPNKALQDPYGDGWLLKIKPTNFDEDVKFIGR